MKNWGHRACLRISRFLKWGYFYWLRIKSLNHFHTEFSHGYLKDTKFCLESKASFIHMSSIASFKVAQNSFLFSSRLLELSAIFQAWNCTVWNDCAIFLR